MDRRRFLGLATGAAAGLTGCLGSGGGSTPDSPAAGTPWALPDHPALDGIAAQPRLGPPPGDAPGLIVAFEDPSCPTCARFETGVFPTLRTDVIDPGRATFVYRGIPIIYPWGEPATYALEATYARDDAAFWQLKTHYFVEQRAFTETNVLDRTETYLAANTDLDAAAVVTDARDRVHDPAVQADLRAASETGVRGTPTFALFSRGSFQTTVAGPQSVDVFERVLGV